MKRLRGRFVISHKINSLEFLSVSREDKGHHVLRKNSS